MSSSFLKTPLWRCSSLGRTWGVYCNQESVPDRFRCGAVWTSALSPGVGLICNVSCFSPCYHGYLHVCPSFFYWYFLPYFDTNIHFTHNINDKLTWKIVNKHSCMCWKTHIKVYFYKHIILYKKTEKQMDFITLIYRGLNPK